MTAPRFTVDAIEQALEQGLAVITLMQLRDALQSGDVAILTKEDRVLAIEKAQCAGSAFTGPHWDSARAWANEARTLLQLPVTAGAR